MMSHCLGLNLEVTISMLHGVMAPNVILPSIERIRFISTNLKMYTPYERGTRETTWSGRYDPTVNLDEFEKGALVFLVTSFSYRVSRG